METKITQTDNSKTIIDPKEDAQNGAKPASLALSVPSRFGAKKFLIGVLSLAVISGLAYFFVSNYNRSKKPVQNSSKIEQSKVAPKVSEPTVGNNRTMLLSKSKIVFPEILESKEIDVKTLPVIWQKLLGNNLEAVKKAEELKYKNSQKGYLVTYPAPASLQEYSAQVAQFIFSNKQDITFIYQSRASYFVVSEFKYGNESFQLTQTADTQEKNSTSTVKIQSIYEN